MGRPSISLLTEALRVLVAKHQGLRPDQVTAELDFDIGSMFRVSFRLPETHEPKRVWEDWEVPEFDPGQVAGHHEADALAKKHGAEWCELRESHSSWFKAEVMLT